MDDETRQRIEVLERRVNEQAGEIAELKRRLTAAKKLARENSNRLGRMQHYGRLAFDESDPRAPLRKTAPDDE